jgi:hypothetical protein
MIAMTLNPDTFRIAGYSKLRTYECEQCLKLRSAGFVRSAAVGVQGNRSACEREDRLPRDRLRLPPRGTYGRVNAMRWTLALALALNPWCIIW